MSLLVIGDLQGCDDSLQRLLERAPGHDRLLFLGDLVNRGPQSLAALRRVRALGDRAITLLGNHDLHLLAAAAGLRRPHRDDTLQEVLAAPDAAELIDWVRTRPLAHREAGALFVHAGLPPQWTVEQALACAAELEARLRADDYRDFLAAMYGDTPSRWDDGLAGHDRLRFIVNALTRLRYVQADGSLELRPTMGPAEAPRGLVPWFDHPERASRPAAGGLPVVFGHWSTLGLMLRDDAVSLDTGCVWGGWLTALSWPERRVWQVGCPGHCRPG